MLPGRLQAENMNNLNRIGSQLELSFETPALPFGRLGRRDRRLARARWWFAQMHVVVDRALDWSPAPPARPEQTCLSLAR
jgi:hypothetical protein